MSTQKEKKIDKKHLRPKGGRSAGRAQNKRPVAKNKASPSNRKPTSAKRIHELEEHVAQLKEKLERAETETAFFKNQLSDSQRQIKSMSESTSWKLTTPIRVLKRLITGSTQDERLRYRARPPVLSSLVWRKLAKLETIKYVGQPNSDVRIKLTHERDTIVTPDRLPIIIHAFHQDVFAELVQRVTAVWPNAILYVSSPIESASVTLRELKNSQLDFKLFETQNIGRDIFPFLSILPYVKADGWSYFLKLHTKKSPQLDNGTAWKNDLFDKLINVHAIRTAIETFNTITSVGVLAPDQHILCLGDFIGNNEQKVKILSTRYQLKEATSEDDVFVAGSMYFGRVDAFQVILNDPLSLDDFEPEAGLVDGTLAHGLERIVGRLAEASGMEVRSIEAPATKPKGLKTASYQFL